MWPDRRLLDLFGIELPIVLAPMAGAMDWELAAEAAEGGALGSLPCAMLSPATLREQLSKIRERTRKPINVNFFCHTPPALSNAREHAWRERLQHYYRELGIDPSAPVPSSNRAPFDAEFCAVVEELKPRVVSFHFGLPEPALVRRVKEAGCLVISSATTVREARWLEQRGVDAIVAQGVEAGGHRGMFLADNLATQAGTFALVPQIVDAVKVPVIAAGAISDARGIAAALALGAAGVQIGSAYLHCPEVQDFGAASCGDQDRGRRRHRADQSDERPSGARRDEPGDARDRAAQRDRAATFRSPRARSRRCAPRRKRRAPATSRRCGPGRPRRSAAPCRRES